MNGVLGMSLAWLHKESCEALTDAPCESAAGGCRRRRERSFLSLPQLLSLQLRAPRLPLRAWLPGRIRMHVPSVTMMMST